MGNDMGKPFEGVGRILPEDYTPSHAPWQGEDVPPAPDDLKKIREDLGNRTRSLDARHGDRLQCGRGCASCCVDDLTVFRVEAEAIQRNHRELLESGTPHGPGACAFLDGEGACRIYRDRPYVCRTQGYPLRWIEEEEQIERRDICPLNEDGEDIVTLDPGDCWTLGPFEGRLAELQDRQEGPGPRRIALRDLFRTKV
jgi:Fe-S-cluster containining protein